MKYFSLIVTIAMSFQIYADELDSISLITPLAYERKSSASETAKSKFMVGAAATFKIDIEKKVVAKIAPFKKDLSGYFTSEAEMNLFVKQIVQEGMDKHLGKVTDEKMIDFYGFLGNNLIGKIADKILAKEGVVDPARRTKWVEKLTQPFNQCIGRSQNSQYDANHCIDALTTSLVPSAGVGIVHELSVANLNSSLPEADRDPFNSKQSDLYKACLAKTKSTANDVKDCALATMKTGVLEVTELSFSKEVNSYLEKSGGLKALGMTEDQVKDFLKDLNGRNKECINQPIVGDAVVQFNKCIKSSINTIASFFGDIQFKKSIGKMYDGREEEKKAIEDQFKKDLAACLATKDGTEFSVDDYTKNLYVCSNKVSASTSMVVGLDQVNSSLNKYLPDRPGSDLSGKREAIKKTLMDNFQACLSDPEKQHTCADELKRQATRTIVINYGQNESKIQLNTEQTPAQLKSVEEDFIKCTDTTLVGDELTAHLDECTKEFALGFAKELGALKLNQLMKQALGSDEYNKQKKKIDEATDSYNECLKSLRKYSIDDGLTEKLSICTTQLTDSGLSIVRSNLNNWMTTEQKDSATVMIKNEFANFLPCLSALLPASPYTPDLGSNVDSVLKPVAILLAQYIDYDPESAHKTLAEIIKKLSVDLNDATATAKAKRELLDYLYNSGALDQFLKGIVRGSVKDAFAGLSEDDLPKELRTLLLKKENFEEIFKSPEGKAIKETVMEKILKPALLGGDTSALKMNMEAIKTDVVKVLINAPAFGGQAVKTSIQNQLNNIGKMSKFFAKILYGKNALKWDVVRLTSDGKKAEEYIKQYVLGPKFRGEPQTQSEKNRINAEAERLVKEAVKNYKN